MASYINQKKAMKENIIEAVKEAGSVDKDKLIAELCLETGFNETTVKKVLKQMVELNYIKIDGMIITIPSEQPQTGGPE